MKLTAEAWLRPSAKLSDLELGGVEGLMAITFLMISEDSQQHWTDCGYTKLGVADITINLETMTPEKINARIDALTAQAQKLREKANAEAAALEAEAFKMLPGYELAQRSQS